MMLTNISVDQAPLNASSDLKKDKIVEAFFNAGNIFRTLGKLDKAIEFYNKCLLLNPEYTNAYYNMGLIFKNQGELNISVEAFKKCVLYKPDFVEAYHNLGIILKNKGEYEKSIKAFRKCIELKPYYTEAYNNIGIVLKDQGKFEEAIETYNYAISIDPYYAQIHNNLGLALKEQDKLDQAIVAFEKALSIKPDYELAWLNGADALEHWNKLDKLEIWLAKAYLSFEIIPSGIKLFKAQLLWRNKNFTEFSKIISEINYQTLPDTLKGKYFILKGKQFEKEKNFDNAFACFSKKNVLAQNSRDYFKYNSGKYFQNLKDQLIKLKTLPPQKTITFPLEKDNFSPVFLIGFPRSGTTLLDNILRSHSKIEVVEEKPAVKSVITFLNRNGYNDLTNKISSKTLLKKTKDIYKTEFQNYVKDFDPAFVYIDKLPLNIVNIPLIHQLYPKAKFIFALRHPMDAILSCWMQDFKLNYAMVNMVDLDRIVELYNKVMSTFKTCRDRYNLNIHEIKYEDLLDDLNGEISPLLKFLDLEWEPQMRNYRKKALKRGRINTPSYSQVVQPIYRHAKYRWINYKKYLDKYFNQIDPWINEFRYTANGKQKKC